MDTDLPTVAEDWSSDGRFVVYSRLEPKSRRDLWVLTLDRERKSTKFLTTEFNEHDARFSPEKPGPGYLAYVSDETGRDQVYVTTFPDPSGGKWLISNDGGYQPKWRRDGKELLYFASDGRLMSVDVTLGPAFKAGVPRLLFRAPIVSAGPTVGHHWDLTADGQRFLINTTTGETSAPITVVLNWQRRATLTTGPR